MKQNEIQTQRIQRDSFVFYRSFQESVESLEREEATTILFAVIRYALDGEEPELTGYLKSIFTLIKPQIDKNNQRYTNGCNGGRPKNQTKTEEKPNENQKETEEKPNETNTEPNANDNVNVNDLKRNLNKEKAETFSLIGDSAFQKTKTDSLKERLISEINTLFHRRPTTAWSTKESKALGEICKRPEVLQEFDEIKALYNSGYEFQRRDVKTLLNNWTTELDRSRNKTATGTDNIQEI